MTGVAWIVELEEVLVHHIADVDVQPPIAIHVGARGASSRAHVHRVSKGMFRHIRERTRACVHEQPVLNTLIKLSAGDAVPQADL